MQSISSDAGAAAAVGSGVAAADSVGGVVITVGLSSVVATAVAVGSGVDDADPVDGVVSTVGLTSVVAAGTQATTTRIRVASTHSVKIFFVFIHVSLL